MKTEKFDTSRFYAALDAERKARSLTWKQVATQAEVSPSTLTRMAQGRRPDVDGLVALCSWSGLRAEEFHVEGRVPKAAPETLAVISTQLRADRNLSEQDADMLQELVQVAYQRLVRKNKG